MPISQPVVDSRDLSVFSLEAYIAEVAVRPNLDRIRQPIIALRLLSFPAVVIAPSSPKFENGKIAFGCGKNCLFSVQTNSLSVMLSKAPLYLLLIDQHDGSLIGTTAIDLSGYTASLSEVAVGRRGFRQGRLTLTDLMANQVGRVDIVLRLSCLGRSLLPHLEQLHPSAMVSESPSPTDGLHMKVNVFENNSAIARTTALAAKTISQYEMPRPIPESTVPCLFYSHDSEGDDTGDPEVSKHATNVDENQKPSEPIVKKKHKVLKTDKQNRRGASSKFPKPKPRNPNRPRLMLPKSNRAFTLLKDANSKKKRLTTTHVQENCLKEPIKNSKTETRASQPIDGAFKDIAAALQSIAHQIERVASQSQVAQQNQLLSRDLHSEIVEAVRTVLDDAHVQAERLPTLEQKVQTLVREVQTDSSLISCLPMEKSVNFENDKISENAYYLQHISDTESTPEEIGQNDPPDIAENRSVDDEVSCVRNFDETDSQTGRIDDTPQSEKDFLESNNPNQMLSSMQSRQVVEDTAFTVSQSSVTTSPNLVVDRRKLSRNASNDTNAESETKDKLDAKRLSITPVESVSSLGKSDLERGHFSKIDATEYDFGLESDISFDSTTDQQENSGKTSTVEADDYTYEDDFELFDSDG